MLRETCIYYRGRDGGKGVREALKMGWASIFVCGFGFEKDSFSMDHKACCIVPPFLRYLSVCYAFRQSRSNKPKSPVGLLSYLFQGSEYT